VKKSRNTVPFSRLLKIEFWELFMKRKGATNFVGFRKSTFNNKKGNGTSIVDIFAKTLAWKQGKRYGQMSFLIFSRWLWAMGKPTMNPTQTQPSA
jgi:hypothetical protein